jgi:hypothetical protein
MDQVCIRSDKSFDLLKIARLGGLYNQFLRVSHLRQSSGRSIATERPK